MCEEPHPAVEPNLGGIGNRRELMRTPVSMTGTRWEPPASHEKPQTDWETNVSRKRMNHRTSQKPSTHALAKKSIVSNRTEREISHESSGALLLVFRRICACSRQSFWCSRGLEQGILCFLCHSVWQHLAGQPASEGKQARWASSVVFEFWIFGDSQGLLVINHLRFVDVRAIIFGVLRGGSEGVVADFQCSLIVELRVWNFLCKLQSVSDICIAVLAILSSLLSFFGEGLGREV